MKGTLQKRKKISHLKKKGVACQRHAQGLSKKKKNEPEKNPHRATLATTRIYLKKGFKERGGENFRKKRRPA